MCTHTRNTDFIPSLCDMLQVSQKHEEKAKRVAWATRILANSCGCSANIVQESGKRHMGRSRKTGFPCDM